MANAKVNAKVGSLTTTVTVTSKVRDMRGLGENFEAFRCDLLEGKWRYKLASSAWSQYAGLICLNQTLKQAVLQLSATRTSLGQIETRVSGHRPPCAVLPVSLALEEGNSPAQADCDATTSPEACLPHHTPLYLNYPWLEKKECSR